MQDFKSDSKKSSCLYKLLSCFGINFTPKQNNDEVRGTVSAPFDDGLNVSKYDVDDVSASSLSPGMYMHNGRFIPN